MDIRVVVAVCVAVIVAWVLVEGPRNALRKALAPLAALASLLLLLIGFWAFQVQPAIDAVEHRIDQATPGLPDIPDAVRDLLRREDR